ncbi:MAG: hypothetical protein HQ518_13020 [Rhodopirellula sp.]|nr:hypothetical protein [Rhodopirellula sp.]
MLASHSEKEPAEETSQQPAYRVAVFSRCSDPDQFTETLVSVLGLNRIDARIHAAHVPGLLPERLTRERAELAAAAINRLGMSAAGISQSDIPNLDHPMVVHHAACREEGLEVLGLRGAQASLVEWPDLEFVSAGYVPLESAQHSSTESMVVVHSVPHTFDETSEHLALSGLECWFIAKHPQRIYVINHNRMNYDYLGSRKTGSASANFGEFLQDVAHFAEQSFLTPATHAFLSRGPVEDYAFSTAERLKQTTQLQFLLHRVIDSEHLPKHE